ncbi:dihydroneopterin aldolase [Pararhizobium mangrovi]|nr:dihydroneopterin aldolase [Pararhizobium mangrovi]
MATYTITLSNCVFFARHGVHDEEEVLGQRFFVDAELSVECGDGLASDTIEGKLDYAMAFAEIQRIMTGKRRRLIETLAHDIARGLCAAFEPVTWAKVTIRKPNAPVPGILDHVAVTVECSA